MFSERTNDGIERSAEQWFKRYNAQEPENGGARKSTATKPREWLENTREQWADHANEALERAGRSERITEASLENQYWEAAEAGNEREMARLQNREPGVHIGPHNVARAERGEDLDRVAEAGDAADRNRVGWIEGALARLDQQIRDLTQQIAEQVRETWKPVPRSRYRGKVMADAMDRIRVAEERYNAVIERTTQLDRHVTTLDTNLANLRWTAEKTVEVLSNLQRELQREEQAAKFRSERVEQANRVPLPMHRWFFPVLFTAFMGGLFGDFVRDFGVRLRELLGG